MPTPTPNEITRSRTSIDIAAPSLSKPGVAVTALQPPPIRTAFAGQGTDTSGSGISWAWIKWLQQLFSSISAQTTALEGTRAQRIASTPSNYPAGSTWYETDTGLLYTNNGTDWIYASGIEQKMQAHLPTGLGFPDTGLLVNVTDYRHVLQWGGAAWEWGPGENGSGFIAAFLANPGGGWHLCNGATVSKLNPDGSVSSITLPDYTTAAYLKLGISLSAGPNAPSGSTTSVSAGTPAGTVSAPSFSGNSDTTSIESADQEVQSGTGITVAGQNHTHTVTPTGTIGVPTFTGTALGTHSHGPGTIELENTQLLSYFRQ